MKEMSSLEKWSLVATIASGIGAVAAMPIAWVITAYAVERARNATGDQSAKARVMATLNR